MSYIPTARELYVLRRRLSAEDECSFFTSLRLRNGTFRTTHVRRLDDLNHLLLSLLPDAHPLRIMDVAVSSGVTTLEWSEALTAAGIAHRITAGDVVLKAFLISFRKYVHVLVDKTGHPLQFEFWGRAVPNPMTRRVHRLYRPLVAYVKAQLVKHFASVSKACETTPTREIIREGGLICRPLILLSPTLGRPAHVEFVDDDIQHNDGLLGRFHVVRAANILNKVYFSDDVMLGMLANLRARLQANGLLVVCRSTHDGINEATVFRLRETGRLETIARLGGGSEVESLALALPPLLQGGS